MNQTQQIIGLEDRITALEAENAVSQRTIDELEIVIERLQKNYNVLHHWGIIGQNAVELAAEALKVDNQDVDPQTMVASLVYSEAVMTTEAKQQLSAKEEFATLAKKLYAMITEFDLRAELSYAKESDLEYIAALAECSELFPDDEPERCACGNNDKAAGLNVCTECYEARNLYPHLFADDQPDES